MNQTTNYGLNQWVSADRIQMEDFNADNDKLESALSALNAASRYVPLKTIVTTEEVAQVDLDVSDIDWSVYPQLIILVQGESTNGARGYVLMNGATSQYFDGESNYSTSDAGTFYVSNNTPRRFMRITITGNCEYPQCDMFYGGSSSTGSYHYQGLRDGETLQTLNFVANNGTFLAGFTLTIYGAKF